LSKTIAIVGQSGTGKSTSLHTLDPKSTFIIDADQKGLPFKGWKSLYNSTNKNYMASSSMPQIIDVLKKIDKDQLHIKTVVIDTISLVMTDDVMAKMKRPGFDKWIDLATIVYDLIRNSNNYREDLTIVFMFHEETFLDEDGIRVRRIQTSGKKLRQINLASLFSVVLFTAVKKEDEKLTYTFETQSNQSEAKTPTGMFDKLNIPNDMALVLNTINKFDN
jgi:ABC-type dipeptide/oligopeptide/nickel transport system ATPase component